MTIGALTEAVLVTAETTTMNTTDASLGNVISGNQLRALPLEGAQRGWSLEPAGRRCLRTD